MAKFKVGDIARITAFKYGLDRYYKAGFKVGDKITIREVHNFHAGEPYYEAAENNAYIFWESELDTVKDDTCSHNCDTCTCHKDTVTINTDIPMNDKKEAHRIVHAMVEKAYTDAAKTKTKPKHTPWTEDEIALARELVSDWAYDVIFGGGDLYWTCRTKDNEISAVVYKTLGWSKQHRGHSAPHHADEYNEWIGKCVSLAKALNKPIPDFITSKNMED